MKIYKYPIKLIPGIEQKIEVQPPARAIHVGLDPAGQACLWAEVDDTGAGSGLKHLRVILVFTGRERPDRVFRHIGSFEEERLVYHAYVLP